MSEPALSRHSLVLYKQKPARIREVNKKKIEIELRDGEVLSVRPKDVDLLHPGPLSSLSQLGKAQGELKTAWELLAGSTISLDELAELAFGDYTAPAAWATWEAVAEGLYFEGKPDSIYVRRAEEVAKEKASREAKAAEEQAWNAFLERANAGTITAEDGGFLQDAVALALGQHDRSQVLRALGQGETPENAHAFLLQVGYWDETANPYPARAGLATNSADAPLGPLADEARLDLTHLIALAIDDEGNQDPDDALSWEDGRLWVHVADVGALVAPDSAADLEARARGANLYLPEGTVTMLPSAATSMLGLGLQQRSPALSFALVVNDAGEVVDMEIVPSWVQVTRMTYAEAEQQLESNPLLKTLLEVADRLQARRQRNEAVEIDLPEVRVRAGEGGQVEIRPLPPLRARDLVREAMLAVGEAVGAYALQQGVVLPFTVQEGPHEPLPPATTPAAMFARRRLMKPSQQTSAPGAHAGLGLGIYVQATSPLRRYLDLVVHQQLRAHLRGEETLDLQEVMARVGAADAVTGDVRYAERQSIRHWTMVYLLQNPDWQGEGIVVDRRGRRDHVLIPELGYETGIFQRQSLALDTRLLLKVRNVDLVHLDAQFRIVETLT